MQPNSEPAEFSHEWFEASSAAWKLNKIRGPNCTYKYRCQKTVSDGKAVVQSAAAYGSAIGGGHKCSRAVYKDQQFCWNHRSEFLAPKVEEK